MPHCTNNYGWYLGKFFLGITGIFLLYVRFLKEPDILCLCRPRKREWARSKGKERADRCTCKKKFSRGQNYYACGCKKRPPPEDAQKEAVLQRVKINTDKDKECCCSHRKTR